MELGKRLKELRKKLGLTQKEFALRIPGRVDYTYIGRIERGQQLPSLKFLRRISQAFGVPLGYFFEKETFPPQKILPWEIKTLLQDRKRQELLKLSQRLQERDVDLTMEIMRLLVGPREKVGIGEKKETYKKKKEVGNLIQKIEKALSSPSSPLSLEEEWVRKTFQIALETLKEKR